MSERERRGRFAGVFSRLWCWGSRAGWAAREWSGAPWSPPRRTIFFLAAKAVGAPTTEVLVRHVLPNIVAPLIVIFSINIGGVILAEASRASWG